MTVTVTPSNPVQGQIVTFRVKYEGNPPPPDDVHVDVLTEDGYVAVVGYDHIPAGLNPVDGFDIRVPPGAWSSTAGEFSFRVRWTRGGKDIASESVSVTTTPRPTLGPPPKKWDWSVFLGKLLGSTLGGALSSFLFNWWTAAGIVVCVVTGAIGGAVGSVVSQILVHWWDAPRKWTFRSAALFNLFFTLSFAMVLGLLAIDLEREIAAQGETWNRVTLGVSAVSAFLATLLTGVLDNLRSDA
jgi:hypothetical protein